MEMGAEESTAMTMTVDYSDGIPIGFPSRRVRFLEKKIHQD
jgi:hypothetical protein